MQRAVLYLTETKKKKKAWNEVTGRLIEFFAKYCHFVCILAHMRDYTEIEGLTVSLLLAFSISFSDGIKFIRLSLPPVQAVKDIWSSA